MILLEELAKALDKALSTGERGEALEQEDIDHMKSLIEEARVTTVLYVLTNEDAYSVAEELDVKIDEDDMHSIRKGVEWGLGDCWHDVLETAIENVVDERGEDK